MSNQKENKCNDHELKSEMNRPYHSAYSSALCRVMLTLFVLELVTTINNGHNYYEAFAVRNTLSLTAAEPTLPSSISKGDDTFSAVGTINSLIITVPETEFNVSNAFKVIVSGDWTLNVHNGNVTYFSANLLASPMGYYTIPYTSNNKFQT